MSFLLEWNDHSILAGITSYLASYQLIYPEFCNKQHEYFGHISDISSQILTRLCSLAQPRDVSVPLHLWESWNRLQNQKYRYVDTDADYTDYNKLD